LGGRPAGQQAVEQDAAARLVEGEDVRVAVDRVGGDVDDAVRDHRRTVYRPAKRRLPDRWREGVGLVDGVDVAATVAGEDPGRQRQGRVADRGRARDRAAGREPGLDRAAARVEREQAPRLV